MHNELSICRAVMRLYSFCDFDVQTSRIKITSAHDLLSSYFAIEPTLKSAFKKVGIELFPTAVHSCFDSQIKIVLEVFFIPTVHSLQIPDKIISCLADTLISLGRTPSLPTAQTLQWAYTGRWTDKEFKHKFITDGLQMSDNRILVDFLTYSEASHDCLHHRLIHELLHTLGVEEEEMPTYILPSCAATYELARPFVQSMMDQVHTVKATFIESTRQLEINEPDLTNLLLRLGNGLCRYGFPEMMDNPIYTTTYMPDKLFPEPSIAGYTVLLM